MSEFVTVYSAEVMRRLRSRPFLIGLVIGALGIVGMIRLPQLLESFASQSNRIILAGDPALLSRARPLLQSNLSVAGVEPGLLSPRASDLQRRRSVAAIVVLRGSGTGLHVTVYAKDPTTSIGGSIRRDLLPLQLRMMTQLPPAEITSLLRMPVDVRPLGSKFESAAQADQARIVANVLIMLLYLLIVLNSQLIMTSVAEEKTSRIAELLIASVHPSALLSGKIAASATLAALQMALWVAIGLAFGTGISPAESFSGQGASPTLSIVGIPAGDVAGFAVFFVVGYLQMATMFAAIGSLVNRTEDIGSIGGPFFIPIIAALFIAFTALEVPEAPAVVVTSFIPLVAPFVMFARIVVSSVPPWQIVLSLAINAGAIWGIAILAGKVYRVGMLLYGRPPSIAQLLRATIR